jgi:hypothetical protein
MTEQQTQRRKGLSLGQWVCLVIVFIVGLMVFSPTVTKCTKTASLIEATSNAKQVFYLLKDFDHDYGSFPNDQTAKAKLELNAYCGEYSNDYLGQLIAGGYYKSEQVFYAKAGSSNQHRPDDDISTRAKTLEEGECGFAYIKGLGMSSHVETPVLLTPMYGDGYKFNAEVHKGRVIALRVDGAVKQYRLDENQHAVMHKGKGKTLFDGGKDTAWGDKGFDSDRLCYVKYPYEYKEPLKSEHKWIIGGLIVIIVIGVSVLKKRLQ